MAEAGGGHLLRYQGLALQPAEQKTPHNALKITALSYQGQHRSLVKIRLHLSPSVPIVEGEAVSGLRNEKINKHWLLLFPVYSAEIEAKVSLVHGAWWQR